MTCRQSQPVTVERLERGLLVLAYLIERDGDVHLAMYAKLEAELIAMRQKQDIKSRARALLASYSTSAGVLSEPN